MTVIELLFWCGVALVGLFAVYGFVAALVGVWLWQTKDDSNQILEDSWRR